MQRILLLLLLTLALADEQTFTLRDILWVPESPSNSFSGLSFDRPRVHSLRHDMPNLRWPLLRMANIHTGNFRMAGAPTKAMPDPTDKTTVMRLAEMSWNAYLLSNSTDWIDIPGWDSNLGFGFNGEALQGHVFGNQDNSILIMAIKGTTFSFFDGKGGTGDNDKYIDNMMFSCCCARVNSRWDPVCNCYNGDGSNNVCGQQCLEQSMQQDPMSYFVFGKIIVDQLIQYYPKADIWLTGHSLGGSLASLLAVEYDFPAFAYEAPGEMLYAERLGLPVNRNNMTHHDIFHYGNNGDPIFIGTCNGAASTCAISGYAMETVCHIGYTCEYDHGGFTNINNHRLAVVMRDFIEPDPVPKCVVIHGCEDCGDWKFV